MKIGDLIEYTGEPKESNGRCCGIVTALDTYREDPLAEILWNTGGRYTGWGWILASRVRVIYEDR